MNETKFEVGKTYEAREGAKGTVLSLDGIPEKPLVVKFKDSDGLQFIRSLHLNGRLYKGTGSNSDTDFDLMPPKREFFVVYDDEGWYGSNPDKKSAFELAASCRGKVIRFIEDGEVK